VIRVKDYEEALALSNDTPFGLSAGIATTSLKYATHFKRHSQAGMVMVNLPTAGVDYHVPFGGRKGSSYGPREQGRYAQEFYTTVKTAYTLRDALACVFADCCFCRAWCPAFSWRGGDQSSSAALMVLTPSALSQTPSSSAS
jgi:aldehyde dehydrogenase (NAD+)